MKILTHPLTGQKFRMGRQRPMPASLPKRLQLKDYLSPALPTPPAGPLYRLHPARLSNFRLYGNDQCGDCTIAAKAHLIGNYTGNITGTPAVFTDEQVLADYSRLSGYKPGDDSTDTGLSEIVVLNDWKTNAGLGIEYKIDSYVTIDATNQQHVMIAIWLFYGAYLGIELPDAWVSPMPSEDGFVWQVAGPPNPENGHAVAAVDYNVNGLTILSWGMYGVITWKAVAKYLAVSGNGEMHIPITKEIIRAGSQTSPQALNWDQLIADSKEI
jgi:hypothetical protein